MSKTRFNKRRLVLKPEWILNGSQSGSATPTATSSNEIQSWPTSSVDQQQNPAPMLCNKADEQLEEGKVNHGNDVLLPSSEGKGAKTKSWYSKLHQSTWTMPSNTDKTDEKSATARKSDSKVKSWTRKLMRNKCPLIKTSRCLHRHRRYHQPQLSTSSQCKLYRRRWGSMIDSKAHTPKARAAARMFPQELPISHQTIRQPDPLRTELSWLS